MPELSDPECLKILQAVPVEPAEAERAFAALFQRYDRRVQCDLRWSFPSLTEHDVQEICQDAWLRVWKSLSEKFKGDAFRSWLYTISRNLAKDRLRRVKVAKAQPLSDDSADPVPDHTHEIAFSEQLQRCVEKLPEKYRSLTKALLELESFDAISEGTNISKARLYQIKHEIRALLLTCMEKSS